MAVFRPFKGVRPVASLVHKVAALPYDVMNREEAKVMAEGNPHSFLHVTRSEIDLPDEIGSYDQAVYEKAVSNLKEMTKTGVLVEETRPKYYVYRQIMEGRSQTGIVGCASIDEYLDDTIKKHEFTRPEKETDRINHFDYCNANTEPIFLAFRSRRAIKETIDQWTTNHEPVYDFQSQDGISHIVWTIDDPETISTLQAEFGQVESLYIADGHHRTASAVKVGLKRREQNPGYTGEEEFNYFMSVIFPDDELLIMDYNRVVSDLNGLSVEEYLQKVSQAFEVHKEDTDRPYKPEAKHHYGMYLEGKWYQLIAKPHLVKDEDYLGRLDVNVLQKNLLEPVLGIKDQRTDKRIDFIGGIRGLKELERRVSKDMKVAFSLYPPSMEELFTVADLGEVMPPKSTWFEPKLRSGLFVHRLT